VESGEEAHGKFEHGEGAANNNRFAAETGEPVALTPIVLL